MNCDILLPKNEKEGILLIKALQAIGIEDCIDETDPKKTYQRILSTWDCINIIPSYKDKNKLIFGGGNKRQKYSTFGELLEIVAAYRPEIVVEVKLNNEYTAIVSKDGIKVGCQEFSLGVIDILAAAKETILKGK
jgi:predicted glycosyltransferase